VDGDPDHFGAARPTPDDKSADHDIVSAVDEAARVNVGQLRVRGLIQVVGFY